MSECCEYLADGVSRKTRCGANADYRYPPRCREHSRCLEYTERLVDGKWEQWPEGSIPRFPFPPEEAEPERDYWFDHCPSCGAETPDNYEALCAKCDSQGLNPKGTEEND